MRRVVVETAPTARRSRTERWLWPVIVGVTALGIAVIGVRTGQEILGGGPLESLDAELQQVQTSSGTYLGRLAKEAQGFYVLEDPATVTAVAAGDGQATEYRVQMLAADPFGVAGPVLVRADQILVASDVHPDSQLARAYREAAGPTPDASPRR
jgi:hypothetical protein